MPITQEFMDHLTPVEIEFIQSCIYKLQKEKVRTDTKNDENLASTVCECPHCKSKKIKRNGHKDGKQRYYCNECHRNFGATTGSMFYHCKNSYDQWSSFIAAELNGMTLEQEAVQIERSITTCFNMRHILYAAVKRMADEQTLRGMIEIDATYTKINLKGTKTENMPRISKRRGKHHTSILNKSLSGISHHKVCIVTAIDENDKILYKVAGLGPETKDKYNLFRTRFKKGSTLINDGKGSIQLFANENGMKTDTIPNIAGKQRYKTDNGNTLASCNELHSELKQLMRSKHGISTRHLQGYLDWLVFCKGIRYATELRRRKSTAYMKVMKEDPAIKTNEICKMKLPISLYDAYSEYHYGIFASEHYLS